MKSASLADDTCSIVRPQGWSPRGGRRWARRRGRGRNGLQMKSWSVQISESSSSAASAVQGVSIGRGVEQREERTSAVMRVMQIWVAGARQSDLCRLPGRATVVHPDLFRAALLDVVASDLRLDPDPVAPPSPSASMTDPAQHRLAGTPPQPRFHLRPAEPRFSRHAPQQYYNCNHCSLHNSIAIANIVL
jgi:hypothetical protein